MSEELGVGPEWTRCAFCGKDAGKPVFSCGFHPCISATFAKGGVVFREPTPYTPDWIVRIGRDWADEVREWCDGKD